MQKLEEKVSELEKQVLTQGIQLEAHQERIINLETNYKEVKELLNDILRVLYQYRHFVILFFGFWILLQSGVVDFAGFLNLIKLM